MTILALFNMCTSSSVELQNPNYSGVTVFTEKPSIQYSSLGPKPAETNSATYDVIGNEYELLGKEEGEGNGGYYHLAKEHQGPPYEVPILAKKKQVDVTRETTDEYSTLQHK